MTGENWDVYAACLDEDPELFFPVSKTGRAEAQLQEAKAVCRGCEVTRECLEFALRTEATEGVWGGYDPAERQQLRRLRARSA